MVKTPFETWLKHVPCDHCGSSDASSLYEDGHLFCSSCKKFTPGNGEEPKERRPGITGPIKITPITTVFNDAKDRHISAHTLKKYGVFNDETKTIFPYFDQDSHHLSNKVRDKPKIFRVEGDIKHAGLFGQQLFPAGSAKAITVVEGEWDALAAFEMHGSRYPVVSIKNGASGAVRDCADNFEYLNSFDAIVLCFDKDEGKVRPDGTVHYPGQEAAIAVANLFPIGKVKVLTLKEAKDANEYLIQGKAKQYVQEWWAAPSYTPSGLKLGKDMWDEISTERNYETISYPWESANYTTYGLRLSEVLLITADTGVGKTQVTREIEAHIIKETKEKHYGLGLLKLEEPNRDTALGIMSIEANKPLHLPDVRAQVDADELRKYYDATVNNDRVVIWDHFGSNSVHEVLAKIRHMVALGCKYIILDHLSIIVSDQSGDERKQLDEISTKLKTLCMELNIAVVAVIHINRQGLIRGSAGPEQIANIVWHLHRDKEDPDIWRRNVTKITCKKNRFCGRTGPMTYLWYDEGTGRMFELNEEEIRIYEAGGTLNKQEEVW